MRHWFFTMLMPYINRIAFENGEYRWQAIGMVHGQAVLLVAHTVQDHNGMDHIRIISARQAEKKERKQYEQNRYLQNGFE